MAFDFYKTTKEGGAKYNGSTLGILEKCLLGYSKTIVLWIMVSLFTRGVNSSLCTIDATDKAVASGHTVSLACSITPEGYRIIKWVFNDESSDGTTIHNSSYFNPINGNKINSSTSDGYFVDESTAGRSILFINETSLSQAGSYSCYCTNRATSTISTTVSNVIVLDSDPSFYSNVSVTVEDPVNLKCSVSFSGKANSTVKLIDSSGTTLSSKDENWCSQNLCNNNVNFTISARPSFDKLYFCEVTLTNASSQLIIYTAKFNMTVLYSVRNVSIVPEDSAKCQNNGFCQQRIKLSCKANGNPDPNFKWTIYSNSSERNMPGNEFLTMYPGQQTFQCTVFNSIGNITYFSSSSFTTNVTDEVYAPAAVSSSTEKTSLIVGLVVGLGGSIIIIVIVIVIIILCHRKKKQMSQSEAQTYTTLNVVESSTGVRQDTYEDLNPSTQNPATSEEKNGSYDYVL